VREINVYWKKKDDLDMKICPNCGAVVPGINVIFHQCPPSIKMEDPGIRVYYGG
jgi:hypothetical protein